MFTLVLYSTPVNVNNIFVLNPLQHFLHIYVYLYQKLIDLCLTTETCNITHMLFLHNMLFFFSVLMIYGKKSESWKL